MSSGQRGFTYLGLLFLVFLLGVAAAMAGSLWSFAARRDSERELLFVGREYRQALAAWQQAHGGAAPKQLEDLLGEKNGKLTRRYIRRLYADPIGAALPWGLVRNPQGGIVGIYSRASGTPIRRQTVYADEKIDFGAARSYADWVFGNPGVARAAPGQLSVSGDTWGDNADIGAPPPPPPPPPTPE